MEKNKKEKKRVEAPIAKENPLKRKHDGHVDAETKAAESLLKKPKFNAPNENWKKLLATMPKKETPTKKPKWLIEREKKRQQGEAKQSPIEEQKQATEIRKKAEKRLAKPISDSKEVTKVLALDCEMVGVGPNGRDSALGRVVIINSYGNVIYDKHVKAKETITDYRTKYSGIRREDLIGAFPFDQVQKEVADLIRDRIVVGHGLKNDFQALMLNHPFPLTRDTAKYRDIQRAKGRPHSLKYLTKTLLGVTIQSGEHDPAEDARAALLIYKHLKKDWELKIKKKKYGRNLGKTKDKDGKKSAPKDDESKQSTSAPDDNDDYDSDDDEIDVRDGDDWDEDSD